MLDGKDVLIIGARAGGYGESLAEAAVTAGARVFGTTLSPDDASEQAFFKGLGVALVDVPLRYEVARRDRVLETLKEIERWLREHGVERLDAVIHAVAGGFPRHPAVMKAVGDILTGKQTFSDLSTSVKREVYYVNAGSFEDTVNGLSGLTHEGTQFVALTYRGNLPYFISPTKKYLERLAVKLARDGKRTLVAALPEAWTQSSQFFKGIELGVLGNYRETLIGQKAIYDQLAHALDEMNESLSIMEGLDGIIEELEIFLEGPWKGIRPTSEPAEVSSLVDELFKKLRKDGTFPILRRSVEAISAFVRKACGAIVIKEFLAEGNYEPGDIRQIYYTDLLGQTAIGLAEPRPRKIHKPSVNRRWIFFNKDEIRNTLSMYGESFLFLDRVIMQAGEVDDGFMGYGRFKVPTPEENPILKDHFIGMPLFGGHLQMEMVGQLSTFAVRRLLDGKKILPILTGTEFPDLNTMAPPGEVLKVMAFVRFIDKRNVTIEAVIENRFARSKGRVRGMVVTERVIRKMLASFRNPDPT